MVEGKLGFFESVTEVDLTDCGFLVGRTCVRGVLRRPWCAEVLAELRSMPSLRSLKLPLSCTEIAVDAELVCGLTTLTTLRVDAREERYGEDDYGTVGDYRGGMWKLDLSRLTTLTSLHLKSCPAVTDKEVLALSNLTGSTSTAATP